MQPKEVRPNTDKRGNIQPGKQYVYEVPKAGGGTKTVVIRDDSKGHIDKDDPSQNRGPILILQIRIIMIINVELANNELFIDAMLSNDGDKSLIEKNS